MPWKHYETLIWLMPACLLSCNLSRTFKKIDSHKVWCHMPHGNFLLYYIKFCVVNCFTHSLYCFTAQFHALVQYPDAMTATTAKTVSSFIHVLTDNVSDKATMLTALFGLWGRAKPQLTTGCAAAVSYRREKRATNHDWAKPGCVFTTLEW